ncbi:MAG: hypothetical protein PHX53_15275 [Syntrophales bacterium]|nr:hypothetical protein [Syntrophales bacterium]
MNEHGLNIRFLAQGMIKLTPNELPEGFFSWSRKDQIGWVKEYWDSLSREDLLEGVSYLTIEEDSVPDCLEADNEDYEVLARTPAWAAFDRPGSSVLEPVETEEE